MGAESPGTSKEGTLSGGARRDSLEEEVFGLGLEGWVGLFHVKTVGGESTKWELYVQRTRGVRGWPWLGSPWRGTAGGWGSEGPGDGRLRAMRRGGVSFILWGPGRLTSRSKSGGDLHLREITSEKVRWITWRDQPGGHGRIWGKTELS